MVNSNMRLEQRPVPIGSEELCDKVLPIYKHVIQSFTPERCMFESNVRPQSLIFCLAPDSPSLPRSLKLLDTCASGDW